MLLLLPVTHPMIDGVYALNQRPAITAPATPVATADKTPTASPTPTTQTTPSQTPTSGSGGTPANTTPPAQPVCVTTYSHGPWQMVREERQAVGQWDLQWLHYERTVTDRCTGDSWTETKVEGPFQLWQSVPDRRVSDVNRPDGPVDGLSGSPLRSSSLPDMPNGGVGPNIVPQDAPVPVKPADSGTPFFPSALLLIGAVVAAWEYRWRRSRLPGRKASPDIPVGPQADLVKLLVELKQKLQGVDPANVSVLPPQIHDICSRIEQLLSEHRSEIPEGFIADALAEDSAVISHLVLYLKKEQLAFLKDNDLFPLDPQWGQDPFYKAYSFLWPVVDSDTQKTIIGLNTDWTKQVQGYFTSLQTERFQLVMGNTPDPDRIWQIVEEEDKIGSPLKGQWTTQQQAAIDERYKEIAVEVGRLSASISGDSARFTAADMKRANELQKTLEFLAPYVSNQIALDGSVAEELEAEAAARAPKTGGVASQGAAKSAAELRDKFKALGWTQLEQWADLIWEKSQAAGVQAEMIAAMMRQEDPTGDPNASAGPNAGQGLMQIEFIDCWKERMPGDTDDEKRKYIMTPANNIGFAASKIFRDIVNTDFKTAEDGSRDELRRFFQYYNYGMGDAEGWVEKRCDDRRNWAKLVTTYHEANDEYGDNLYWHKVLYNYDRLMGRTVLDVPLLKQGDTRWGTVTLGNSTVEGIGCTLTSVAMVINHHKPGTIDSRTKMASLRDHITNEDGSLLWASESTKDYLKGLGLQLDRTAIADEETLLKTLHDNMVNGLPTIVGVKGAKTHWVVVTGYIGSDPAHLRLEDFTINDPGADRLTLKDFRTDYGTSDWDCSVTIDRQ